MHSFRLDLHPYPCHPYGHALLPPLPRQNLNPLGLFRNAIVRVEVSPHNEVHNEVHSCVQTVPAGPNDEYPNHYRIRDSEQGERCEHSFINRRSGDRFPSPAPAIFSLPPRRDPHSLPRVFCWLRPGRLGIFPDSAEVEREKSRLEITYSRKDICDRHAAQARAISNRR